jgi:hypothetical protein
MIAHVTARSRSSKASAIRRAKPDISPLERPRAKRTEQEYEHPAGVAGRNFGYWQADGATRSAAKRSKRP